MILATHAITGGAIGYLLPQNPIISFSLGFLSHFLADAIPHWHYQPISAKRTPDGKIMNDMIIGWSFLLDLIIIGTEFILGLYVSIYFLHPNLVLDNAIISILAGAFGGILPDPLMFLSWKFSNIALRNLGIFHMWLHSKINIDNWHFLGITAQIVFSAVIIWVVKLI